MIKRRYRATQKHVTSSYVFCCVCALNDDFHQHGFWISRKTDSLEHTTYCACNESPHLFTLNEDINKSNNYIVPPANNRLTETDKKDKPKLYKKKEFTEHLAAGVTFFRQSTMMTSSSRGCC